MHYAYTKSPQLDPQCNARWFPPRDLGAVMTEVPPETTLIGKIKDVMHNLHDLRP